VPPEKKRHVDPSTHETRVSPDIGFGNTYRLEYIKTLLSIGTGVLVFSVTFMKDLVGKPLSQVVDKEFLVAGWGVLIVSVVAGIFHMRLWASYYISWGLSAATEPGYRHRRILNRNRKIAEYTQLAAFLAGLILLVIFASLNLFY
jgi:amino acid transporter